MPHTWRRRSRRRQYEHAGSLTKRVGRGVVIVACTLAFLMVLGGTAFAQFSAPDVTVEEGVGENCNGIVPTPGSENTVKTLVGGSLIPGGTAQFKIEYPVDAEHLGDEWEIVDCVLIGNGTDLKDYTEIAKATFSGVINSTAFVLNFTFSIPADAVVGSRICNVAKTTEGPSAPQASNRKAGPACFILGGGARVEKHSTTDPNGDPIGGATFLVNNCVNTSLTPSLQPLLVDGIPILPGPGSLTILSATGVITLAGAVGSHCDFTETIPPDGYGLPTVTKQTVTITSPTSVTVVKFLDPPAPGDLQILKVAPAGSTQTFTFNIVCTNPDATYTRTITGSGTATVTDIPAGSSCTVTETSLPGFVAPVYSPSQTVEIPSDELVTITVTNRFAPGSLIINKTAPAGATDTFTFSVSCVTAEGTTVYPASIVGSGSATISGIAPLSVCTVTETNLPAGYAAPTFDPPTGTVTIPGGAVEPVTVSVTNTQLLLGLSIVKTASPLSGVPGDSVTYTYVVTNTGEVELLNIVVTDDKLGDIGTIASLAPGASATLTKTTTLPDEAGLLTNVATATGTDRFGRTATATDDATVTVVLPTRVVRPAPLPETGANVGHLAWVGLAFLMLGTLMLMLSRRRHEGDLAFAAVSTEPRRASAGILSAGLAGRIHRRWRGPGYRAGPFRRPPG